METSIFISKFLAVVYLAVGIGLVFSMSFYEKLYEEFKANAACVYLGGLLALAAGFTIVTFHNRWEPDWPIVITIFGWLAVLKGIFLLAFPERFMATMDKVTPAFMGVARFVAVLFGLFFAYFGFFS